MKSTGVVRKIDELGRIVVPMELRRTLGIEEKASLEFFIEGDTILLKKYNPGCLICEGFHDIVYMNNKAICGDCRRGFTDDKKHNILRR